MQNLTVQSTRCIANCDKSADPSMPLSSNQITSLLEAGFSLLELLVTSTLGLIIISLVLSVTLAENNVFKKDIVRTRLNENIRGTLDIINTNVRLGGENLGVSFPAIEIVNGASSAPDQLTNRRNLIAEILPVCTAIATGTNARLVFAIPGNVAGCVYSGQTHNYNTWRTYRTSNAGQVDAYVYDTAAKVGEFFKYIAERDLATSYDIQRTGNWSHNYPTVSSAAYILEEWKFSIDTPTKTLQLVKNQDNANPLNVGFGIKDLQAQVTLQDATVKTSFTSSDMWTNIKTVQVTLTGTDQFLGTEVTRSVTGNFFPRNVLSN